MFIQFYTVSLTVISCDGYFHGNRMFSFKKVIRELALFLFSCQKRENVLRFSGDPTCHFRKMSYSTRGQSQAERSRTPSTAMCGTIRRESMLKNLIETSNFGGFDKVL